MQNNNRVYPVRPAAMRVRLTAMSESVPRTSSACLSCPLVATGSSRNIAYTHLSLFLEAELIIFLLCVACAFTCIIPAIWMEEKKEMMYHLMIHNRYS